MPVEPHSDPRPGGSPSRLAELPTHTLCALWEYTEPRVLGPDHEAMALLRGLLLDEWDRRGLGDRVDAWIDTESMVKTRLSPRPFLIQ